MYQSPKFICSKILFQAFLHIEQKYTWRIRISILVLILLYLHSGPGVRPALLSVLFARMSEGVQLQQQLQGG